MKLIQGAPPIDNIFINGPRVVAATDSRTLVPVFNGTGGNPTHAVFVEVISTSAVSVTEVRRVGNVWVHDGTLARDASVTLSQTMTDINVLTAFAIENPVAESARVLFVVFNQASATPDALVINSINLAGGETLAAVAVTIAGANAIPAADLVAAIGTAITTALVGFVSLNDFYQGILSGTVAGFTLTFTAAVVADIDASINVNTTLAANYSMCLIGSTILLVDSTAGGTSLHLTNHSMWTITTAGVKIAEYLDVGAGFTTGATLNTRSRVFPFKGRFYLGSPPGNTGMGYVLSYIPLSSLTAN